MDTTVESLKDEIDMFAISVGKDTEQIFEKCLELCKKHSLNAESFVEHWVTYAATNSGTEINGNTLDVFEKQCLLNRKEEPKKPNVSITNFNTTAGDTKVEVFGQAFVDVDSDNDMEDDDVLGLYGVKPAYTGTPKVEKKPTARLKSLADTPNGDFSPVGYSPALQLKSASYGARMKAGDAVLRYKCKDSDYWGDAGGNEQAIKINPVSSTNSLIRSRAGFKYMFQGSADMAAVLNSIIGDIGYDMLNEDDKEIHDLRVSSVEECWYLGRIRNEEGRLSQNSTFLEGDLDISGGHVVSLDLSDAEEYRLFPGQVVLLKGKNEMGKCLRVTEVAAVPPIPLPLVPPKSTRPINVIVASGPFTPVDSLVYEPLWDLVEVLKRDKPDVCILAGPFVDPTHPLITDVGIADTFEEFFEKLLEKIKLSISDFNTQLVVVSSCKDAHHHAVYPTPPYELTKPELLRKSEKLTILPDPAMFEVAGITIGFTSVDILKHLANTEIARSTITDRMGGLSKLILSQKSFYPLYPPDESVPLDVQLWARHCKFPSTPQILILPSDLRYFIKEVEGTIVINPERLTKGKSGGTYARFQVKLPDSMDTEIQSVADFCCGEIMKI